MLTMKATRTSQSGSIHTLHGVGHRWKCCPQRNPIPEDKQTADRLRAISRREHLSGEWIPPSMQYTTTNGKWTFEMSGWHFT